MSQSSSIFWFADLALQDARKVGNKAAVLGELYAHDVSVPNGFVVGSQLYYDFLVESKLDQKIAGLLDGLDIHDSTSLHTTSTQIQQLLIKTKPSELIQAQIVQAYHQLSGKDIYVAVRPSVAISDQVSHIFEGPHTAHLNLKGKEQLIEAIKRQWSCVFMPRALHYVYEHGLDPLKVAVSIIVQRMVDAEVSGLLFTSDPLIPDGSVASIEAIWGLGEPLIEGQLIPDHYQVQTSTWSVIKKDVVRQEWQLAKAAQAATDPTTANKKIPVSISWQKKPKLAHASIIKLAKIGAKVADLLKQPQEIEWVFAHNTFFIVQTRPSVSLSALVEHGPLSTSESQVDLHLNAAVPPLLSGEGFSPGYACGSVFIVTTAQQLSHIPPDSVIFTTNVELDIAKHLSNVIAVVIDKKVSSSPQLQAAKEKGIPVVTGTINGSKMVKNGETVSVDGTHGRVFEGYVANTIDRKKVRAEHASVTHASSSTLVHSHPVIHASKNLPIKTATKVFINITEPDTAEEYAIKDVDGVGLLRAEYIIKQLGEHPKDLLLRKKEAAYVEAIYEGLKQVAKSFAPRPVIYRMNDLTTNQFRSLNGGEELEVREDNPHLGYRGAYRYIAEPDVLRLEIQAIKKVRQYYKNLWVMVPFVRTPQELVEIKRLLANEGLHRGGSFKLFMMAEVPSNIFLLDQFIGVGIDGLTIGSNDLTQLVLGLDRHNPRVAPGFDERNEAVMVAMETIVRGAAKHGIFSSICGQAPSAYPELTQKLVEWGISAISVSPEAASTTRRLVANAEFELVRQGRIIQYRE